MPNRIGVQRNLLGGMKDYAKQMRAQQLRKKYSRDLPPELAEVAASGDEAGEAAQMPPADGAWGGDVATMGKGIADVAAVADEDAEKNKAALAAVSEDELDEWMATRGRK